MTNEQRLARRDARTRDAYSDGWSAQANGLPISANPHRAGLDAYCAWRDGWYASYESRKPVSPQWLCAS